MLKNSPKIVVEGDRDRRWMSDDYFDLIIWYKTDGAIYGFQLCYGKPRLERALTWLQDRGFSHTGVDAGEERPTRNRSPILVRDGYFPAEKVMQEFERRAKELPKELRQFVTSKISQFAPKGASKTPR